ncbi:MAG TPA: N-acyl homoserine lactonase family protein [Candidatus Binatia bacterium]|nr:N-acyl homoserine lactonase family protein [Candidatus Binatia bacterium]
MTAGDVTLHAFACGWLTASRSAFVARATGRLRVPVPSFLVRHPKGTVLFDSGLHPETAAAPAARLGRLARWFEAALGPGEDVAARLRALGVDPERVDWLVTSHLHFDHTGGHAAVPNARLVVQRAEWEAGRDAEQRARLAYDPHDFDCGHARLLVDGEHDLFGDGRVVCLPTPGHTPGHQSLRVRLAGGDVVLTADACYFRDTLDTLALPRFAWDRDAMLASLGRLRALRDAGARLVYGHDPADWATVPQAPAAVTC